jgi:hypothetical protein
MRTFVTCTRGNVALIFAIAAVGITGVAGLALDYSRLNDTRTEMQAEADAAALSARDGAWISETEYRVEASKSVELTLLQVLGFDMTDVRVESVALFAEPGVNYDPPLLAQLDPEAMDYNQMSVYCFDPATRERSQFTIIGDNNGHTFDKVMPTCRRGEKLEVMLVNRRLGRVNPAEMTNPQADIRTYYSDDLGGRDILETVRCDTEAQCRYLSEGGIIPEGPHRTPLRETRACVPGKYYYYGWEDRPDGDEFADRDFNDIRLVIKCGIEMVEQRRALRLVR